MGKLGVGFVGAGWMGATLLHRLSEREEVEIRGLHQRRQDRAEATLSAIGLPADLYKRDYRELLDDPDCHAIFIASPNALHGPQSIAALEAGKHVFCEKPCATRFANFMRQIELARANPKLITFVDYLMNFDTMEERIAEMVREGVFGQITQVQVNYRHPVNIVGDKAWKLDASIMGDAIGMGIIHSLSVMMNVMKAQAAPISVFATSQRAAVRKFEPDAMWSIQVGFDNGAQGFCFGNIDTGANYDAYHNLYGTDGGFVFDSQVDRPQKVRYWSGTHTNSKWVYPLDAERCAREGVEAWPSDTTTPDSGDVIHHQTSACVEHFLECVSTGVQSPLSFINSASTAEVGWAAQMSAKLERPISLPLDYDAAARFFAGQEHAGGAA